MIRRPIEHGSAAARVILAAVLAAGGGIARADTTGTIAPSEAPAVETAAPDVVPAEVTQESAAGATGQDNTAEAPPAPGVVTPEQVRAALAEAQQHRETLRQPDPAVADPAVRQELLERWGVEVYGVRLAARGYMIDFRFRVLDAEKALPLFDTRIKPYLLPERTTVKLPVPAGEKVGAFRTTNRGANIVANKDYYLMFGNPDAFAKRGQKVSVVIGDFHVEHLTLQ